jgi:hypothetical protein
MTIKHSESEPMPRLGVRYRCHICRLELVLDPARHKLAVRPFDDGDTPQKTTPKG